MLKVMASGAEAITNGQARRRQAVHPAKLLPRTRTARLTVTIQPRLTRRHEFSDLD
jgi:hypothetical protein